VPRAIQRKKRRTRWPPERSYHGVTSETAPRPKEAASELTAEARRTQRSDHFPPRISASFVPLPVTLPSVLRQPRRGRCAWAPGSWPQSAAVVSERVKSTSRRWPADTRRSPALLGFDVHSHAFILAPWRACLSKARSVRFFNTLSWATVPSSRSAKATISEGSGPSSSMGQLLSKESSSRDHLASMVVDRDDHLARGWVTLGRDCWSRRTSSAWFTSSPCAASVWSGSDGCQSFTRACKSERSYSSGSWAEKFAPSRLRAFPSSPSALKSASPGSR
jgi:hypothetical protein